MKKSKEELVGLAKDLWEIGVKEGFRVIRWTKDGNVDYDWAREISNSRFDLHPVAIAFPRSAEQVARCVTFCVESGVPFRVRSGGHQHEGMSSLDDGVVIRLSELSAIQYEGEKHAWIGVGKPLKEIYDELELQKKTIPGGGCWSVNVGGLALGGGWGTSIRKMGLTCDNFDAVEMVTADGEVILVRKDGEKYRDLFWALRGGGGGNFGIVTRFLFRLHEIDTAVTTFAMQWKEGTEEHLTNVVHGYLEEQAKFPLELTAVMGLRVKHRFMKEGQYFPLRMAGKFYGSAKDLRGHLKAFIDKYKPDEVSKNLKPVVPKKEDGTGELVAQENGLEFGQDSLLSDLIAGVIDFIHRDPSDLGILGGEEKENSVVAKAEYVQKAPPGTTCLAAWPHKISSGFPKGPHVYKDLARKAVRIILRTNKNLPDNAARLYMVLHGMLGTKGKIKPWESAFFWRDKDVLVQFQAWWAKPCLAKGDEQGKRAYERDAKRYLCWIRNSRKQLDSELEGAFINFVDRDLPVETYYGDNYARLREIKKRYDRDNIFHFPLSIPPAEDPRTRLTSQGFDVVTPDDPSYEASRSISNALFDLHPSAVVYPWKAEQVALCVRYCRENKIPLRIRSGGHQHEGMCSADGALMVRLSEMKCIEFVEGRDDQAWIGVGARLEDVYGELQKRRKIIAAGGCKSVNVGGLTLGGGWGLSARKFGLASDNVLAAEVVLADGKIVRATKNNQFSDLFWALFGSGGGNFGIATRFLFRLHEIEPNLSKYKLYWKGKENREAIIKKWLAFQRSAQSTDTTSYLVLYADLEGENKPRYSVYAGGASYSQRETLEAEVGNLTDGLPKADKSDFSALFPAKGLAEGVDAPESAASFAAIGDFFSYAEDPPGLFNVPLDLEFIASENLASDCRVAPPKDNCLGSFPHKVTSAFPKPDSDSGSLEGVRGAPGRCAV